MKKVLGLVTIAALSVGSFDLNAMIPQGNNLGQQNQFIPFNQGQQGMPNGQQNQFMVSDIQMLYILHQQRNILMQTYCSAMRSVINQQQKKSKHKHHKNKSKHKHPEAENNGKASIAISGEDEISLTSQTEYTDNYVTDDNSTAENTTSLNFILPPPPPSVLLPAYINNNSADSSSDDEGNVQRGPNISEIRRVRNSLRPTQQQHQQPQEVNAAADNRVSSLIRFYDDFFKDHR